MIISMPNVLYPNTVDVKKYTYTTDAEGGTVETLASTTSGVACNVQLAKLDRATDQAREGEIATHTVYFKTDPVVKVGDRLQFGTKVLSVLSSGDASGGNRSAYRVDCKERT